MNRVPALHRLLAFVAAFLASCASSAETAAHGFTGELAPFPYTPAEIRRANPPKTVLVYRMDGGERSFIQTMSFLASKDPERVRIQMKRLNESGNTLGQPETTTTTWKELRDHASFPAEATVRTEERVQTPGGTFDCWLYTIEQGGQDVGESGDAGGQRNTTARFWFAHDKPGPPVLYETERDGVITSRMILLEYRRP